MEFLVLICLMACFVCPSLIFFVILGLVFYAMYCVMGFALFIPIIGLLVAGWISSMFNPTLEQKRQEYKKACKDYDDIMFRLYHPDEYWAQQKRKQKKPSAATIKKCKRLLREADEREKSKLPISKDYVNRWR